MLRVNLLSSLVHEPKLLLRKLPLPVTELVVIIVVVQLYF